MGAIPSHVERLEANIKDVVDRIFASRRITRADQARFMSALLSKSSLTDAELQQINRVFDALRIGRVKVVD